MQTETKIKCSKCGHVGPKSEFPTGRDFFQNEYVASCPKNCGNRQNPGDASMRMFGGVRPFTVVREAESGDAVDRTMHRAEEAS